MSSRSTIRVVQIGCGDHVVENLLPSLLLIPDVSIVGVCDRDKSRVGIARRLATQAEGYLDWRTALDDLKPDAVVAACPPQVHYQIASAALRRKIHVFVEKPPTVNLAKLERLAAIAAENKLIACVGHNLRYAEQFAVLRKEVAKPQFGSPVMMDVRYWCRAPRGPRWGLKSSVRSLLLSHAIHALDLFVLVLGPTKQARGLIVEARDGALTLSVQLVFRGPAIGNLVVTTTAAFFSLEVVVIGRNNKIVRMDGLRDVSVLGYGGASRYETKRIQARMLTRGFSYAGYLEELKSFISGIQGKTYQGPTFQDELETYRTMDQIENNLVN